MCVCFSNNIIGKKVSEKAELMRIEVQLHLGEK